MYRSVKTIITIFLCLMLLTSIMPFALAADVSESVDIPISVEYDNISIGAGGSFFQPTINPIDSSQYIVTSDMGGIYYTSTSGNQWNRTNICRISASCMTDNGVYFAGAYGLYVSYDNGQTMKMIYPRENTVQYTINRLGRDNPLMVADGYDNGYVIAVNTYGDYVYFITMDWNSSGTIRICRSLFDGTALEVWTVAAPVASPMNVTYRMEMDNNTIFYSDGSNVWSYDISTSELTVVYTAQGSIVDMKKIGEYYFILDDTDTATNVIYTTDFASFDDLNTFNTLTNEFRWGGVDRTLEWHYSAISGTDFNNIWLAFYSPVSGISDIGGVLKFDGTEIPDSDLLWHSDDATQTAKSKNGILEQLGRMIVQDHYKEEDCVYIANLAIAALKNGKTSREIEKAIRNVRTANKRAAADPDSDWLRRQAVEAANVLHRMGGAFNEHP